MRPARLRRFLRDRSGATAVEFAMVVGPFIFMLFAVFEYVLAFLVSATLDTATVKAARLIKTGEAQTANVTPATFKTMVCNNMGWLASECPGALDVDVRVFTKFSDATDPDPTTGGNFDKTKLQFSMGGPESIILVTTYYKWKLLTYALVNGLSTPMYGSGFYGATGRAVFRNEPYI